MARISIDTDVCRAEAAKIQELSERLASLEAQVEQAYNSIGSFAAGDWFIALEQDIERTKSVLIRLSGIATEISTDLTATANGFDNDDTTSAGYFGRV
jgi:uncharacterized protein YukE